MPAEHDHLRWTRLDIEPTRKPPTPFGSQPRPRADRGEHARRLSEESTAAVKSIGEQRRSLGIDLSRLLALKMRFLGDTQRELLKKIDIDVLHEHEERTPFDVPQYELPVEFPTATAASVFRNLPNLDHHGIETVHPVAGPAGKEHPTRLVLQFPDLAKAERCCDPNRQGMLASFQVRAPKGKPDKKAIVKKKELVVSVATVQCRDQRAADRLFGEIRAFRNKEDESLKLTVVERAILCDAIESFEKIGPDQRIGRRLRRESIPDSDAFMLDVDLWHPGSHALFRDAQTQFLKLVEDSGGLVLGPVQPILQTLMIARIQGNRELLEMLSNYDRVSRVDLPPVVTLEPSSVFEHSPVMAAPNVIPADGPLACVVDSGIVSGHPLLRDLVIDAEDFGTDEDTPVDSTGHGTEVAGVVAYGDIRSCLETDQQWTPKVRLINAKVMQAERDIYGNVCRAVFSSQQRAESQISDAIRRFATDPDRNCRVFNLSFGNENCQLGQGHQLPWALMLDEIARELDIVIVVSAGNVSSPNVPTPASTEEFQHSIREQLLTDEHSLIDPASAINVLTVGSIARHDIPHSRIPGDGRSDLVASPKNCPSPFTRTGVLKTNGSGISKAVKPDLVAHGGNYSLSSDGRWNERDQSLAEPVLNFDPAQRLLRYSIGTSIAAPYVTHVCAVAEHRLRQLNPGGRVSASLIRAFVAHSTLVPEETEQWFGEGRTEPEAFKRRLRAIGYGRPESDRACFSTENRVVLYAEDKLDERKFHLYRIELPDDFVNKTGQRIIRATLAFDPPVRGTRLEYQARAMNMQLFRGLSTEEITQAAAKLDGDATNIQLPKRTKRLKPQRFEWSTLQSLACVIKNKNGAAYSQDDQSHRQTWHLLVGCKHRFPVEETADPQRYAVVFSLEHSDEKVRLYQHLKNQVQVEQRVRV